MKKSIIILMMIAIAMNIPVRAQRSLTIDQAIEIALKNNPAVKIEKSKVKEAGAKEVQAHSTFLPQADMLTKYFYTNNLPGMYPLEGVSVPVMNNGTPTGDNITMHPMAPYPNLDRDVLTFDFNLVYPLYAGNKRVNAVESTRKLREANGQNVKETEASVSLKVKTAFYNNLFLNEVIKVYEEALQQMNAHLDLAKKAYKEGVRSEFDVLNFQSKIEEFKSKIIELKGKKKIARTALKNLLALPGDEEVICEGSIADALKGEQTAVNIDMTDIEAGNHKLQYLQTMREVLDNKKKIEAAAKIPTLFAFGNYHIYHGKDFPPFDKTWRNGYALGVGLKINLFDGNMYKGKVQEVKAIQERLDGYREGLALQLRYQYEKSLENIQAFEAEKKAHTVHLQVAEKAYKIAEVGYKNGVTTNIELNDAQLNVTKIKTKILSIEKNILLEYANLAYLKGNE